MTAADWNAKVIADFRANEGKVQGPLGAYVTLVHHRGRKSGKDFLTPLVYLPDDADADTLYLFASKAGAPTNPDWYYNLTSAGTAVVEVGTEKFSTTVAEVTGPARDEVFAAQVAKMPGFADYAEKTKGIRTIPVLALHRSR